MSPGNAATLGLVLAGGRASRMGGGDKSLLEIGGQSILSRVTERLSGQCGRIIINANGDPSRFSFTGLPVVADETPDFAGPLAGILAGLEWAAKHSPDAKYVLSVPGDCPFLPRDLAIKLESARQKAGAPIVCAKSGEWRHPVIGLWPVSLRSDLREALGQGLHKVQVWAARHGAAVAEWSDRPFDPFFNVNTPEDLVRANDIAGQFPDA